MESNWLNLWRELIIANPHTLFGESMQRYRDHARQKRQRPDPLLDSVLQSVDNNISVLDIGAGNGRWTIPLAEKAGAVTAIEPDTDMLEVLRGNIKATGVNIRIVQSTWEQARAEVHDFVVCAHAMYSSPDLASFVRKMEQNARKACYMAIRLPPADGVIGELSDIIFGSIYDSVNALIAYNALYSLGIYANVLVENNIYRWTNTNLEEAFFRAKRHLHLETNSTYDGLIREKLGQRLIPVNNSFVWPDGMRSALLWWSPSEASKQLEM